MNEVLAIAQLSIGLTFLMSCISKVRERESFQLIIQLHGVPREYAAAASHSLLFGELCISVMLLLGMFAIIALLLAMSLLSVFLGVMIRNALHNESLPCYCFGNTDSEIAPLKTITRIILLMIVNVTVIIGTLSMSSRLSVLVTEKPFTYAGASIGGLELCFAVVSALGCLVIAIWMFQLPTLLVSHHSVTSITPIRQRVSVRHLPYDLQERETST